MAAAGVPLLSVTRTKDGVWSVAVLERDGVVHLSRDYNQGPDSTSVETP